MKRLRIFFFIILPIGWGLNLWAQSTSTPGKDYSKIEQTILQKNSQRKWSYRNMFYYDKKLDEVYKDLGKKCFDFVSQHYKSGKTFFSPLVYEAIVPMDSMKLRSKIQDNTFYHWTNTRGVYNLLNGPEPDRAKAHQDALKTGSYDDLFDFLRTRPVTKNNQFAMWYRAFYVAEDPYSSQSFGKHQVLFHLDNKCPSLEWSNRLWARALKEFKFKYPEMKKTCRTYLLDSLLFTNQVGYGDIYISYHPLLQLIAEDSGVTLVNYLRDAWFQMLTPNCIKQVEFNYF